MASEQVNIVALIYPQADKVDEVFIPYLFHFLFNIFPLRIFLM